MFNSAVTVILAFLAAQVAAHGAVTSYVIGGTTYPGYTGFSPASSPPTIEWQWPNYDPILDPSVSKITCNGGTSAALSATVPAGQTVTAKWAQWTHMEGSVAVYLFKCAGAFSACTGSGAGWFKIDEAGLLSGTMYKGTWGVGQVLTTGQWTSTIPAKLAPGNYLIRHELIAVHQSNTPQFYPECAQLVITGSGSDSPSGSFLVSIPGYAKLSDSNVRFDIYADSAKTVSVWKVPGPAVWPGNGNQSGAPVQTGAPPVTAAPTQPPPVSTSAAFPSTGPPILPPTATRSTVPILPPTPTRSTVPPVVVVPTPPVATVAPAPLYGQCGGKDWTGATTCASGTCTTMGEYYSQCMP